MKRSLSCPDRSLATGPSPSEEGSFKLMGVIFEAAEALPRGQVTCSEPEVPKFLSPPSPEPCATDSRTSIVAEDDLPGWACSWAFSCLSCESAMDLLKPRTGRTATSFLSTSSSSSFGALCPLRQTRAPYSLAFV